MPKLNLIHSLKIDIENRLFMLLPKEHVGILEGMLIGDTSYISDEVKDSFKTCGITHLLAVSGSNVAFVMLFCMILFERIFGRNISNFLTIIFLILFMLLSGASASVVRATIMAIIMIISEFFSQKYDIKASISISAIIILLYNPLIIYDVGFVLSFMGTIGIIMLYKNIYNGIIATIKNANSFKKLVIETLSVTLSAQLILVPIMIYYFNTLSIISILANIIIIPITGSMTIIGFIIYLFSIICFPIAKILSYIIFTLISIMIIISKLFSSISFSSIFVPTPSFLFFLIYYLIIILIIKDNKLIKAYFKELIYMILIVLIIKHIFLIIPNKYISVNMVDVGQGDCIYIESIHRKTILVDTGGSEGSNYDVGEKVVFPYLLDRGKTKVDYIFISHMHEDHAEGLVFLLDNIKIGTIIINKQECYNDLYNQINLKANENNVEILIVDEGDIVIIDDIKYKILLSEEKMDNLNNASVIMKMEFGETSMLFTGDAELEAEQLLKNNIRADILKVGHHGSNTSTSEDFIKKVKPEIALISVGKNNKFNHPKKEIIERLNNNNIEVFRTDYNGEIMMKLYKNNKIIIKTLY